MQYLDTINEIEIYGADEGEATTPDFPYIGVLYEGEVVEHLEEAAIKLFPSIVFFSREEDRDHNDTEIVETLQQLKEDNPAADSQNIAPVIDFFTGSRVA